MLRKEIFGIQDKELATEASQILLGFRTALEGGRNKNAFGILSDIEELEEIALHQNVTTIWYKDGSGIEMTLAYLPKNK